MFILPETRRGPSSGGGGGGQEDGIAMKGAQSKVKWGGAMEGTWCEWGPRPPPPRPPHSYATVGWMRRVQTKKGKMTSENNVFKIIVYS